MSDITTAQPDDRGLLTILATSSIVLAGLTAFLYGLTAFISPDWTIAGPGAVIAAAGAAGQRRSTRWLHIIGVVPIVTVLSVAGSVIAYDLARPDQTAYFTVMVLFVTASTAAAAFGPASALRATRSPIAPITITIVAMPLMFVAVVSTNPASAEPGGIDAADRASATDIELIDTAFVVDPDTLRPGTVVHLRNTGNLPHDFTIDELDIAVFVPSGRNTHLRLPESLPTSYQIVCTIGDHAERGMLIDVNT